MMMFLRNKKNKNIFFSSPQKSFSKKSWKNVIFCLSDTFDLTYSFLPVVDKQCHFLLRRHFEREFK